MASLTGMDLASRSAPVAKKWISKAVRHPGAEKAAAKRAGMSTHAYMEEHKDDPGKAGARARLGLRLSSMAKTMYDHPRSKKA